MKKVAIIAGSTGLVGGALLKMLINSDSYQKVIAIGRRKVQLEHPVLVQSVVDFDLLEEAQLPPAEDVFCCLGTTIKQAGSKAAFKKVDLEYVANLARICRSQGTQRFNLVSSIGADVHSWFFYSRIKGLAEREVSGMDFPSLNVFRPSLLLGSRNEKRAGEDVSRVILNLLSPVLVGRLKKYRPVEAETVALAMYKVAQTDASGTHIYESDTLRDLAGEFSP